MAMRFKFKRMLLVLLHVGFFGWTGLLTTSPQAFAMPINLHDNFYRDPTVIVASDGLSAVLEEDPAFGSVLLSNDPVLGDPNVIIPGVGVFLAFTFDFVEGDGEDDEFSAFIVDASTGDPVASDDFAFFFSTQETSLDTVSFDLSTLVGQLLGLQFELRSYDTGLTSYVTVSDVHLETAPAVVPEPSTLLLVAGGLLGLGMQRRWVRSKHTRESRT